MTIAQLRRVTNMKFYNEQTGSSIILIAIVIAVIGIGATLGYMAYDRINNSDDENKITTQSSVAEDVNVNTVPEVEDTSDLDAALESLDQIDESSTDADSTLIDSQLSEF